MNYLIMLVSLQNFVIEGEETPDLKKAVRWCLAKDDVSVQDIFRLAKGGPADLAIVAKYCMQDCNIPHELMKKNDMITTFIVMALNEINTMKIIMSRIKK